jgi:Protein of unknown function (DUF2845)
MRSSHNAVTLAVMAAAAFSLGRAALADDVMRCGATLIMIGMIAPEVIAKCGEPASKEVEDVPIRVRHANGSTGTVGSTRIEHWTYDLGYGQFKRRLTFEEGKLTAIEMLTHR